jgi:proteic killer suppression protein
LVIKTFTCRDTEALFDGRRVARFTNIAAVAIRKLQMVHAVTRVETLRVPPQNRLEKLSGDRKGQWSIRVNDQFRVCFVWRDGGAWDVEIVDYH